MDVLVNRTTSGDYSITVPADGGKYSLYVLYYYFRDASPTFSETPLEMTYDGVSFTEIEYASMYHTYAYNAGCPLLTTYYTRLLVGALRLVDPSPGTRNMVITAGQITAARVVLFRGEDTGKTYSNQGQSYGYEVTHSYSQAHPRSVLMSLTKPYILGSEGVRSSINISVYHDAVVIPQGLRAEQEKSLYAYWVGVGSLNFFNIGVWATPLRTPAPLWAMGKM